MISGQIRVVQDFMYSDQNFIYRIYQSKVCVKNTNLSRKQQIDKFTNSGCSCKTGSVAQWWNSLEKVEGRRGRELSVREGRRKAVELLE